MNTSSTTTTTTTMTDSMIIGDCWFPFSFFILLIIIISCILILIAFQKLYLFRITKFHMHRQIIKSKSNNMLSINNSSHQNNINDSQFHVSENSDEPYNSTIQLPPLQIKTPIKYSERQKRTHILQKQRLRKEYFH